MGKGTRHEGTVCEVYIKRDINTTYRYIIYGLMFELGSLLSNAEESNPITMTVSLSQNGVKVLLSEDELFFLFFFFYDFYFFHYS